MSKRKILDAVLLMVSALFMAVKTVSEKYKPSETGEEN